MHNVASDAHDRDRRPPGLRDGFERLDADLPGLAERTLVVHRLGAGSHPRGRRASAGPDADKPGRTGLAPGAEASKSPLIAGGRTSSGARPSAIPAKKYAGLTLRGDNVPERRPPS